MKKVFALLLALFLLTVPAFASESDTLPPVELPVEEPIVEVPVVPIAPEPIPEPEPVPEPSSVIQVEVGESGTTGDLPVPELRDLTGTDLATGSTFNFDFNFNDLANLIDFISTSILPAVPEPEPREGVAGVVQALLGEYIPRTYEIEYVSMGVIVETDTQYVPGLAGLDWEWIAGAVFFSLTLYSFFRLLGGLFK